MNFSLSSDEHEAANGGYKNMVRPYPPRGCSAVAVSQGVDSNGAAQRVAAQLEALRILIANTSESPGWIPALG
jgi:hypothetical protein